LTLINDRRGFTPVPWFPPENENEEDENENESDDYEEDSETETFKSEPVPDRSGEHSIFSLTNPIA
jgi:hypothetical protein